MKKEYNLEFNISKYIKNITCKDNIKIIPIFIPHLGCNNNCVFCNQRKISGNNIPKKIEEVKEEIEMELDNLDGKNNLIQIAFFGGSFTGLTIIEQINYLKLANEYINIGKVDSIRISTRPDYINKKILQVLKKYNVKTIELGVQSMDNEVLTVSKRGHTDLDVKKAARLINLFGFELGFQIMVGLPKSTIDKEIYTIKILKKYKAKYLRIYPVYVLKESELYDMYIDKIYYPLKLDEASSRTSLIIKECLDTDIKIIRIGLQATDKITSANQEVIGPVSDNFADWSISKLILPDLENKIKSILEKDKDISKLNINTNNKYHSFVSGPSKCNKNYIETKYNIKIKFKGDIK